MKIDLYKNGKYLCSTTRAKSCKQAINAIKAFPEITIAGRGIVKLSQDDKLSASINRG